MEYRLIKEMIENLIKDDKHIVSVLANCSSILYNNIDNLNWVGFYIYEDELYVGPFQGKIACSPLPKHIGVCWKAVDTFQTIIVDNVHNFDGHIACDTCSKSEIVIPIIIDKKIYGVLDIDSDIYDRFKDIDKEGLEQIVNIITNKIKELI